MKNLIKIIASLTALTLMTACAGGVTINPVVNNGTTTDCKTNAFHADCNADAPAIKLRQSMCLADTEIDSTCVGEDGIATVFCTANPFDAGTACGHADYDDDRAKIQTDCLAGTGEEGTCDRAVEVVCGANPYDRFCLEEEDYDAARMQIQNDCQSSATACTETTLNNYCMANLFRRLCSSADYDIFRTPLCIEDKTTNDCTNTIVRACTDDPFSDLCAGESNYNNTREGICVTETTSPRCMPTVDRVCPPNIYDPVCTGTTYADMRSVADSQTEIGTRDCANNPAVGACIFLYAFLCGEKPLDSLCDAQGKYRPARRTLCLKETADPVACATTISQVCSANSLEDLCVGVDAYASLQAAACRGESATSKPECAATLTLVCGNLAGTSDTGNPFGPVCSNAVFQPARSAISLACVGDASGRLCVSERNRICGNTPFNPVCKRSEYLYLQIRACIGKTAEGNCVDDTFFTDPVILSCLTDPFDSACTASDSAFKPYETDALDATCLLAASGTRAGCANPTAVFATLPTSLLALRQKPAEPHHIFTNPYRNGFITIESTDLDDNGNLVASFGESGNFEIATTRADGSSNRDHTALELNVRAGGAIVDDPKTTDINEANPFIPGGAVTLRRDSGATDNSDSDDGVAYFATTDPGGNSDGLAYGGILPTTNLGAPLLPQPVADGADNITAIWNGHVSYRQNPNVQNRVTNFYVDFTAGTIGFANTAETDGTGVVDAPIAVGGTNLRLSGKFGDSHNGLDGLPLAPGELGGTVGFYFGVFSATNTKPNVGEFNLHGLIGQEGVVGVFLNTTTGGTLVGGFTASNPDHPNNQ